MNRELKHKGAYETSESTAIKHKRIQQLLPLALPLPLLLLLVLVLLHINVRYEVLFIVVDVLNLMCWNKVLGPLLNNFPMVFISTTINSVT